MFSEINMASTHAHCPYSPEVEDTGVVLIEALVIRHHLEEQSGTKHNI